MSNDAKKLVLARRAKFMAAAIAGIGVACGKEPKTDDGGAAPGPCLSVYVAPDAGAPDVDRPRVCLSPPRPTDAGRGPCKCAPGDPLCSCL
jgi:hypothetical protein